MPRPLSLRAMPSRPKSPRARARAALNAAIETLYQDTRVPVREIARLAGVSERNIYALVRRLGCRTRGRRPVPAKQRIDKPASAACRNAARHHRKLVLRAAAERDARMAARERRRDRARLLRTLTCLSRALRDLAAIRIGQAARRKPADADLEARRQALARRLAAL
jgi:hypothetical protein